MTDDRKSDNPEKPEEIIDDIVTRLDAMHDAYVNGATQVGYTRDAFRAVRSTWASLGNASSSDPEAARLYSSGINFLFTIRDEIRSREPQLRPVSGLPQQLSGSANSFVAATDSTVGFVMGPSGTGTRSVSLHSTAPDQHDLYAERFSRLDPALGNTYREIWETLYGTRADPVRAALYLIRQAFDQLFEKLAPDDDVRRSPHWMPKSEPSKENHIWREERIRFAASTHVRDAVRANTLAASAKHMLDVYQALNRAHDRRELDLAKSRPALSEMRAILEDWIDAVENI